MCGEKIADSREHKYKQSDIKASLSLIKDSVIVKFGRARRIHGTKSSLLKFSRNLCRECNNQKSKEIDNSYDSFSKRHIKHLSINLSEIAFINITEKTNFYRYLTKNFCCRLVDNNIEISNDLVDFVNHRIESPERLIICIYGKSFEIEQIQNSLTYTSAFFGRGSLILYSSSKNRNQIDLVYSTLICCNLTIEYFYLNQDLNLKNYYDHDKIEISKYTKPENIANRINKIVERLV